MRKTFSRSQFFYNLVRFQAVLTGGQGAQQTGRSPFRCKEAATCAKSRAGRLNSMLGLESNYL